MVFLETERKVAFVIQLFRTRDTPYFLQILSNRATHVPCFLCPRGNECPDTRYSERVMSWFQKLPRTNDRKIKLAITRDDSPIDLTTMSLPAGRLPHRPDRWLIVVFTRSRFGHRLVTIRTRIDRRNAGSAHDSAATHRDDTRRSLVASNQFPIMTSLKPNVVAYTGVSECNPDRDFNGKWITRRSIRRWRRCRLRDPCIPPNARLSWHLFTDRGHSTFTHCVTTKSTEEARLIMIPRDNRTRYTAIVVSSRFPITVSPI